MAKSKNNNKSNKNNNKNKKKGSSNNRNKKIDPVLILTKRVKKLDPYLRLHLMAQRGEDFYKRFQKLLGVTDADFPATRQNEGPYMGNGLYMGEKGKFEALLHVNRGTHSAFTSKYMGVDITRSRRSSTAAGVSGNSSRRSSTMSSFSNPYVARALIRLWISST